MDISIAGRRVDALVAALLYYTAMTVIVLGGVPVPTAVMVALYAGPPLLLGISLTVRAIDAVLHRASVSWRLRHAGHSAIC